MFCLGSLQDRFWRYVKRSIDRRVDEILPLPDAKVARVGFLNHECVELTKPLEIPPMPTQDINLTLAGDSEFGYKLSGIVFTNRVGAPLDVQPDPATVAVVSSNPMAAIAAYLGNGELHIQTFRDGVEPTPGDITVISISADETGPDDDARVHVTIGADRVGRVNLGDATLTELQAPLTPAEPPTDTVGGGGDSGSDTTEGATGGDTTGGGASDPADTVSGGASG